MAIPRSDAAASASPSKVADASDVSVHQEVIRYRAIDLRP